MHHSKHFLFFIIPVILFSVFYWYFNETIDYNSSYGPYCSEIDIVYTWVNGSDPELIRQREEFRTINSAEYDASKMRFRDFQTLRYSLRSVEMFVKFYRKIFLVTNGQVPYWLNLNNSKLELVKHSDIFNNSKNLPTFNSNAIESQLHNIKGLSECFIYLNDDVLITSPLSQFDFINPTNGRQQIYFGEYSAPQPEYMKVNLWHRSVGYTNTKLEEIFGNKSTHWYPLHGFFFFQMRILETIYNLWPNDLKNTSSHRFRQEDDMFLAFLYANVAMEMFSGIRNQRFNTLGFGIVTSNLTENEQVYSRLLHFIPPKCVCLQDGIEFDINTELENQIREHMQDKYLDVLYPYASSFEIVEPEVAEIKERKRVERETLFKQIWGSIYAPIARSERDVIYFLISTCFVCSILVLGFCCLHNRNIKEQQQSVFNRKHYLD